jgi:SecY interacting protein Syd
LSIKESMSQYFKLRKEFADGGLDFLFKTPVNEDAGSLIYVGEIDEEDYITWKPVEKNTTHDLTQLEEKLGVNFHSSIIEYFNSY